MKTLLIAISLVTIIGLDCSLHLVDDFTSFEITIELGSESSESESKESSEKNLNDYIKSNFQQLLVIQSDFTNIYCTSHYQDHYYHNHWDEIPYPPPEFC